VEEDNELSISEDLLFDVLDRLRTSLIYLDPPDDWKEHKWLTKEDFVNQELGPTYKKLMYAMADEMDVDIGQ
jgi:hypothetical protein